MKSRAIVIALLTVGAACLPALTIFRISAGSTFRAIARAAQAYQESVAATQLTPLPGKGLPAKLILMNKVTGKVEMERILQTARPDDPKSVHGQFRHVRMTKAGTYLVPHLNMGKVVEYDKDWKEIWSVPAPSAWAAVRLKNGNTLISGNQHGYVREVNPKGETVWEINYSTSRASLRRAPCDGEEHHVHVLGEYDVASESGCFGVGRSGRHAVKEIRPGRIRP